MNEVNKLGFKNIVMEAIYQEEFVIVLDEQMECLKEIIQDIKVERKIQLKELA